MSIYIDGLYRNIEVTTAPKRVISIVPSLTETLFTFGAADIVMGVTDFCVEPPEAMKSKVRVGGTKTLDIEKVKEMKPDLVIANAEENREEDIRQLVRSGIKVFVTFPRTVSAAIKMMRQIAEMTETLDRAEPILQEADETLAEVTALSQTKPRPRVFCPIWRRPWMSVGADTYTHDFIAVCGGRNLFADRHDRYPRIELDEVARRIPDVILLPNEPYNFREEHKADFTDRTHVPAVRDDRIHIVDGKILCWYGPRIAKGLRFINGLLQNPASKNKASGKTSKAST